MHVTGQVATVVATTAGVVATVMALRRQALLALHPQVNPSEPSLFSGYDAHLQAIVHET